MAFELPLAYIYNDKFNQPIFGANNLSGDYSAAMLGSLRRMCSDEAVTLEYSPTAACYGQVSGRHIMTEREESSCMQDTAGLQCKAGARLEALLHISSCCTSERAASAHSSICTIGELAPKAALLAPG